jgi:hypothetical protein
MASVPKPRMTLKEYLELEEHSEECHEFHDGEVFAVAGGTRRHSEMITGIGSELRRQIRAAKADCHVYIQMRLFIAAYSRAVYPDVRLLAGERNCYRQVQMARPCSTLWRSSRSCLSQPGITIGETSSFTTAQSLRCVNTYASTRISYGSNTGCGPMRPGFSPIIWTYIPS